MSKTPKNWRKITFFRNFGKKWIFTRIWQFLGVLLNFCEIFYIFHRMFHDTRSQKINIYHKRVTSAPRVSILEQILRKWKNFKFSEKNPNFRKKWRFWGIFRPRPNLRRIFYSPRRNFWRPKYLKWNLQTNQMTFAPWISIFGQKLANLAHFELSCKKQPFFATQRGRFCPFLGNFCLFFAVFSRKNAFLYFQAFETTKSYVGQHLTTFSSNTSSYLAQKPPKKS